MLVGLDGNIAKFMRLLFLLAVLSGISSASKPNPKRYMVSIPSSQDKLIAAMNPGAGNLLHSMFSDYDLLTMTMRRLLSPYSHDRGSEEGRRLVNSIKLAKGISTMGAVTHALLEVVDGPAQKFVAKTYRGSSSWKRSFFIDAKPESPAFEQSDLSDALQMLRDYIALISRPLQPLIEYFPPQFREPGTYTPLLAADQPHLGWKRLSLASSAGVFTVIRDGLNNPLIRIRSVLHAPGLNQVMMRHGDSKFRGNFVCTQRGLLEASSGRYVRLNQGVRLLPEMSTLIILESRDGVATCSVHFPTRTEAVPIPDAQVLAGVLYSKDKDVVALMFLSPDSNIHTVQLHSGPKGTPFAESLIQSQKSPCRAYWNSNNNAVFVSNLGTAKSGEIRQLSGTQNFAILATTTAEVYSEVKQALRTFNPQSLSDATRNLPGTPEKQRKLAIALSTMDKSLAWSYMIDNLEPGVISAEKIVNMYRETFQ